MKHLIYISAMVIILFPYCHPSQKGRSLWTEQQAWEWHKKVGVIKGFNEPISAYPGMSRKQIFEKASKLGFNSVRFWIHAEGADEQIKWIREFAEDADEYGLTVSPVLSISDHFFPREDKMQAFDEAKAYTQKIIGAFANDKRIIFWDIWNEPLMADVPEMYEQMDWIEAAVQWCREMSPIQPITASIIWDSGVKPDSVSRAINRRYEVEAMMDIHNFHLYDTGLDHMQRVEWIVERARSISDRPLVCTETIARTKGGTFPRTFVPFAQNEIHFFTWGLYICDMNWTVSWGQSTYDPYEPWFHDLLHPDGEPYDKREIDWLRNFHFAEKDEIIDPGAEWTERWTKDRAWKWMVGGPVKGVAYTEDVSSYPEVYNGWRVQCNYNEWKENKELFYQKMDDLLFRAKVTGMRITPALLSDEFINEKDIDLAFYVSQVIKRYAADPRIQAWEIYTHPGSIETNTDKLKNLLSLLFRYARYEYPNQPLTATPYVKVKDFEPDFNYKEALIHGRLRGWDMLVCEGGSSPELCNHVWALSDIISFSIRQNAPEAGWLTSIAYRYGRPLVCTEWVPPSVQAAKETLDIFAKSHVFWYNVSNWHDKQLIDVFQFEPISTPIR